MVTEDGNDQLESAVARVERSLVSLQRPVGADRGAAGVNMALEG